MKPRLGGGGGSALLLVVLSICLWTSVVRVKAASTDSDYHYDDEYDDEYDDDGGYDGEDQSPKVAPAADSDKWSSNTTITVTTTSTSTTASSRMGKTTAVPIWSAEEEVREDYPCPRGCTCEDGTRFVNCSHRALTELPTDLPRNAIRLDFAGNNIKQVPVEAFQNCTDVRVILLDRNVIEEIVKEVFTELARLDVVSLVGNQITHLTPDTFGEAQSLRKLVLSENPLMIPDDGPFLLQEELEELELVGCNLTELHHETFSGLEGLKSLNLAGNDFGEDLNTDVFEPLVNLQRLHVPFLSEDNVRVLCDVIKSIDVVDITAHNISCFYLASETSYEESIITQRPTTPEPKKEQPKESGDHDASQNTTPKSPGKKVTRKENEIIPPKEEESAKPTTIAPTVRPTSMPSRRHTTGGSTGPATTPAVTSTPIVTGPSSASITHSGGSGEAPTAAAGGQDVVKKESTPTAQDGEKTMLASISSETMKQLLMGIIGAGILILIIGLICRRTGLKNKLCGSKRRPAPTDQVRPAEEVPLNKV
ncbi:uncharacterized protein LOC129764530 isoform X2 [Toxorhynchites rutilus septentrionalis]|uniref:uncharacterized protein LOC129764530 isoform X2 n=1 Tax=Toxorhynchites rutilus septentrionalis TaxID=329112 RepID=UPI00247A84B3|nr:uncharacterized protein LOC129764530 isoform X2 [Toxorhynchites rutilus septentrionalis]